MSVLVFRGRLYFYMTSTSEGSGKRWGLARQALTAIWAPVCIVSLSLSFAITAHAAAIGEYGRYFDGQIPSLADRTLARYGDMIDIAALLHDEDSLLIASVIVVESEGNPKATSKRGAKGLMQLMPATALAMGAKDPADPMDNILAGTKYLKHLQDDYGFTREEALVAYNMGPTRAKRWLSQYEATEFFYTKKVLAVRAYLESEKVQGHLADNETTRTGSVSTVKNFFASLVGARPLLTKPRLFSSASQPPAGLRSDAETDVISE